MPCTTARTQTGLRTVLVEADASAIDRHTNMTWITPLKHISERQLANSVVTYRLHAKLEYLLERPNGVP